MKRESERLDRNNAVPMTAKIMLGMKNCDRARAAWKTEVSGVGESVWSDAMRLPEASNWRATNQA
jgi:hypothetical protein